MKKTTIAVLAALMVLMSAVPALAHGETGLDGESRRQIAQLYASTAKYHRVSNAIADGFGPFSTGPEEITCFDDDVMGGMGVHYVRNVGDGKVDAADPEALVYEVTRNGRLRLVAVEYVVLQSEFPAGPPTLFGQTFTPKTFTLTDVSGPVGELAIYKLHVWIWKWNPSGLFADHNPRVGDCP